MKTEFIKRPATQLKLAVEAFVIELDAGNLTEEDCWDRVIDIQYFTEKLKRSIKHEPETKQTRGL